MIWETVGAIISWLPSSQQPQRPFRSSFSTTGEQMFPSKLALSTHPVPLTLYKMLQLTICYGGREEGGINPFYSFNHVLVHNGVRPFPTNSSCYKTCIDTFVSQQVVLRKEFYTVRAVSMTLMYMSASFGFCFKSRSAQPLFTVCNLNYKMIAYIRLVYINLLTLSFLIIY